VHGKTLQPMHLTVFEICDAMVIVLTQRLSAQDGQSYA
jgi:hypothetical protein